MRWSSWVGGESLMIHTKLKQAVSKNMKKKYLFYEIGLYTHVCSFSHQCIYTIIYIYIDFIDLRTENCITCIIFRLVTNINTL